MCGIASTTWPAIFFIFLTCFNLTTYGQKLPIITGKVLSADNRPIPGATIKEKGTSNGVVADNDGNFKITPTKENAVLEISAVGFEKSETAAQAGSPKNITLARASSSLNDVVVVGYGTQKKVNLTGAVVSISAVQVEDRPITQASQALAGLAPGVTVSQNSGRPGNDGAGITVRGLGTFSGAGNSPLVLIDGLASSIDQVDPYNIKSISVLKDAASAAIYGTRAANGVILIETKRGRSGKMQVSYNSYVGKQHVTALPDFLDSWEYATLLNEANVNGGGSAIYTDQEIQKFRDGSDPDNYPNVPHLKNLLNSGSGFQTYHNVSVTGGDNRNVYLFSGGYLQQDGLVAKNGYKKYNFLFNFDSHIKDNLTLNVNLSGNTSNTTEPRQSGGDMASIIGYAVREGPIYAGRKSDGTYGYMDNYGPEAWMSSNSFYKGNQKYFLGGTELTWEIFKGFSLSGKGGYNYTNNNSTSFSSDFQFNPTKYVGPNNLTVFTSENSLLTLQSLARYNRRFGLHDLNILAGYSQEQNKYSWQQGYRQNFPNNLLYTLNAGSATGMSATGSAEEWALRSWFGRINYAFDNKYLLEVNARYDGTSRFPASGRWGFFPSISGGWKISEERFVKENAQWIDLLKIRASWGKLGNQNIGNYPYQNIISLGQNYSFGGTLSSGAAVTTLANRAITWETTRITDVGFDLSVLNGELSMSVDYFDKYTSGILYSISVSSVLGLTPSAVNAGAVKNTGVDILLNYRKTLGKVHLGISPNFSFVNNRVMQLASGLKQDIGQNLFVGKPLNSIYGYVADGLFTDANDVANSPAQPYAAQPGFIKYKDLSGADGKPDGKTDATYDRTVIGNTMPKYAYGATITADYKGFDLSILLQGLAGFEKQMGSYMAFAFYNGGQIQRWQADNRWTTSNPNPHASYPKLTTLNMGSGTIASSTYWNRNASFLRMKNLQLGYSFSSSMLERIKIDRLRLYVSGQNLFTINKFYKGWDPEMYQATGDGPSFYPITRVYTFGVNVKF